MVTAAVLAFAVTAAAAVVVLIAVVTIVVVFIPIIVVMTLYVGKEGYCAINYSEAFHNFHLAATQGEHMYAMYFLGLCYAYGRGVPTKNQTEAVKWYRCSAELGHSIC